MNCPKCQKETTHDMTFGSIDYYICELCGHKFGYIDQGKATKKEIQEFQKKFQRKFEQKVRGFEPVRDTLIRAGIKLPKPKNIKLHDPKKRTSIGNLRARG